MRHGATDNSATQNYTYQDNTQPLSQHGRKQAEEAAKEIGRLPIDMLLSSPYVRALETAEIIAKATYLPVIQDPLLHEIRRPSCFIGRISEEPEVKVIRSIINQNIAQPDYRHSDEETFSEYQKRSEKLLKKLSKLPNKRVVIVSHEAFIKLLTITVLLGDKLTPELYLQIYQALTVRNTGITTLEYTTVYKLISFNDHGHLTFD